MKEHGNMCGATLTILEWIQRWITMLLKVWSRFFHVHCPPAQKYFPIQGQLHVQTTIFAKIGTTKCSLNI